MGPEFPAKLVSEPVSEPNAKAPAVVQRKSLLPRGRGRHGIVISAPARDRCWIDSPSRLPLSVSRTPALLPIAAGALPRGWSPLGDPLQRKRRQVDSGRLGYRGP